jgi:hypothetical protein
VEPSWVSRRLFNIEVFAGVVCDPACGFGRILKSASAAGYQTRAYDIADRGYRYLDGVRDFLVATDPVDNIVSNPPYHLLERFALHALELARIKTALLIPVRRLNAATWLEATPLTAIHLLTPRPSLPPGRVALDLESQGKQPSGGTQDYCWLVFQHGHNGPATVGWLRREPPPAAAEILMHPKCGRCPLGIGRGDAQ